MDYHRPLLPAESGRIARTFWGLYLITFATSIPAGVDRDRRSGCGHRPRFLPTSASAPLESWLAGVDERAALVGVERVE